MKVKIEYFTDPLCAWSYVSEPSIQALMSRFGGHVDFEFRSLPILDRTAGKAQPGQRIRSPEEMQSEWENIAYKSGVKINADLWNEDPPHSSWPSNRAMKAAFRQGFDKGAAFTHNLREAIMKQARNSSDLEVLKDVAAHSGLDVDQFYHDMTKNATELEQEVANDRLDAVSRCIDSTPTLVAQNDEGDKMTLVGTMDYEVASRAIRSLMGERVIGSPEVEVEVAPSI